ncbi:hypothetical protein THAOC_04011 [Thalassiosira oceanica]|uniref:Uncharacterized protein n=1 Tax=Thalassiosira oceanica TaxID=159749 RepID=K0TK36_THAOC|nr:hypothetical protein THAOC_04011 [Thalassiosira oceanica]|eukprot:EJK74321.1 hypothetical protein THAOC_04011 [Thalassiosira oceanica]
MRFNSTGTLWAAGTGEQPPTRWPGETEEPQSTGFPALRDDAAGPAGTVAGAGRADSRARTPDGGGTRFQTPRDGPRRGDDTAAPAGAAGAGRADAAARLGSWGLMGAAVPFQTPWDGHRQPRLAQRGRRLGSGRVAGPLMGAAARFQTPLDGPRRGDDAAAPAGTVAGGGPCRADAATRGRGAFLGMARTRDGDAAAARSRGPYWAGRGGSSGTSPSATTRQPARSAGATRGTALRNDEDVPTGLCLLLPGTPRPLTSITTLSQSDQSECRPNPPAPSLAFLPLAGLLLGLTFITGTTIMSNDYLTVSKSNGLTVHSSTNKRRWYSSFLGVASVTAAAVLQHSTKEIIVPPTSTKNFRAFLSCSTQSLSGKIKTLRRKTSNPTIENYLATRKEDTVLFFLLNVTNDMLLSRELQDIFSEEELEAIRSHGMGLPLSAKRWKLEDRLEEVRQKLDFLIVVFIPEKLFPFEGK